MSKVEESKGPKKRENKVKYSEIEGDEIDEATINEVLGKTKHKSRERHAFDGIE